jgi:chemotaxis-related protein WspB
MLLVLFNVGEEVHAIDAASVVEVLPLVDIKKLKGAPRGVAGTFNYRGTFVPVIDLSDLLLGRPVAARLSTRLILARYSAVGMNRLVGIVAENATETLRREASDITSPGIVTEAAPYLDSIVKGPNGFIQRIDIDKLAGAVLPSLLLSA